MQQNLLELLKERKVSHPSKIISTTIKANRELSIVVEGFPWWKDNPSVEDNDHIEFLFFDVSDGALKLSDFAQEWWSRALEPFEVSETSKYSWADADGLELFCSKPLKNPLALYVALHDYLVLEDSIHDAKCFLNFGGSDSFDLFLKYSSTNSYLLSRAPKAVSDVIAKELEFQGVPFRASPTKRASCATFLVKIGNSTFFCEKAIAQFDG